MIKKLLFAAIAAFCFAVPSVKAQLNIDDFDLVYEDGDNDSLTITVTLQNDSGEYFIHRDTDPGFSNPDVVLPAQLIGPSAQSQTFGFRDLGLVGGPLIPGTVYYYRLTLRNYPGQAVTLPVAVPTTTYAEIGPDLTVSVFGPTSVELGAKYSKHGSLATIEVYDSVTNAFVTAVSNLNGVGFSDVAIPITQAANSTHSYYARISNLANPGVYDSARTVHPVVTPNYPAQAPSVVSLVVDSVHSDKVFVTGILRSDSLSAMVFTSASVDGFVTSSSGIPQPIASGTDTVHVVINHTFPASTNGQVKMVIQNLFNGYSADSMIVGFTTPIAPQTPENLVPRVLNPNYAASTATIAVYPIHVQAASAMVQLNAARVSNPGLAMTFVTYLQHVDTAIANTFYGLPDTCYVFSTYVIDTVAGVQELRQSQFSDFNPPFCFATTGIDDAPVDGWGGSVQDFDPIADFRTGYAWPLYVVNMMGQVLIDSRFSNWSDLYHSLPNGGPYIVATHPDKRTQIVKTMVLSFVLN